jgi:hypothetical protein
LFRRKNRSTVVPKGGQFGVSFELRDECEHAAWHGLHLQSAWLTTPHLDRWAGVSSGVSWFLISVRLGALQCLQTKPKGSP